MSASKEVRVAEVRRRERPGELETASAAPSTKKQPSKLATEQTTSSGQSADCSDSGDEGTASPTTSPKSDTSLPNSVPAVHSPPVVPKLSPSIHVRTSSLGHASRSPESPRTTSRRLISSIKHERRESLLGRSTGAISASFPGSPHGSSLRDHSSTQPFLEMDTDSDEDSPFPPPISYTEQVSHIRSVNVAVRARQNAAVPLYNTHTRRMLTGIRERRIVQERSSQTASDNSPTNGSPMSPSSSGAKQVMYRLERGGVVVGTSVGPIQFGIPPETIKDSLAMGFEVPQIYVAPKNRFDTVAGLNMCEVEFPGYYQFFLRNRSMTIICSAEAEKSLRNSMHEILQGPPEAHLYTEEECVADDESRPDHVKEMAFFVRPRNGRSITVDSLFSFVTFEPCHSTFGDFFLEPKPRMDGLDLETVVAKARLPGQGDVEIHETSREWIVYERDMEVARVEFWQASNVPPRFPLAMVLPTNTFTPPMLGVTVLGSSHGFDAKQSTSGFVLWMHGRGIMVDPPPNATDLLKRSGISPRWISAIILTHCHADHDAGTFQKILVEGRVTLMTTKTIMASFLRKYSKISGFTEAFLCRLFEPRIVRINEDVFYSGGVIRFFYSLHALPCIGFRVSVAGKSIAYSADTLYDPKMLQELCEEGVLSEKRRDALLSFPFETVDVVIHEAGIPPIHTPVDVLKALSENARSRLYLIHIAESAAEASGLRLARAGTEHTIRVADGDSHAFNLDVLTNSELFFPFLTSSNKFGRGIVTAAQERMGLMDYENPSPLDFSFLDCSNATGSKRFYTSSNPGSHGRDRGSSIVLHRSSNLADGSTRDSDLSLGSMKRHSGGFDTVSPSRHFISAAGVGRRTASTNKSLLFAPDMDEDDFTVPQVADLLRLAKKIHRDANEIVSANEGEGDVGLYLILKGFCRVERTRFAKDLVMDEERVQPAEGPVGTILEPGDCFGLFVVNENRENMLLRKCVIRTLTEVELIELNMDALWYLLNVYPALDHRLSRMHELRALEAWRTMELNSCLRRLASFQRTQLNAVLELKEFKKGEELWSKRPGPRNAFLVAEGELTFPELSDDMDGRPFGAGAFLCDFHSMIVNRRPSSSSTISSAAQPSASSTQPIVAHDVAVPAANVVHNSSSNSLTSAENEYHHQQVPAVTLLAKTDCRLYQINWRDMFQFLESNPGVLVQIYHSFVVE